MYKGKIFFQTFFGELPFYGLDTEPEPEPQPEPLLVKSWNRNRDRQK